MSTQTVVARSIRSPGAFTRLFGAAREMLNAVFMARFGDPPVRGTREFLEVYETSPWIRAVLGRISSSVAETEWTLEDSRSGEKIEDNLLLRVLDRPNSLMSGADLLKISQLHLDLVGDVFWLKNRNAFGAPVEYWPIPPHWVAELPTPMRPTFRLGYYGLQTQIPSSEIFWHRDPAPLNPYGRGSGIARAQGDEIESYEYASKHAKQTFFNRATPEFVVMDSGASQDEIKIHEQTWLQRLQGYWKANKPYFVNRKLDFWQPSQMNMENLTMVPLMKFDRDVFLQVVGMPPEQLGIVESSNRATADASDYVYESRVVRPRRCSLRDALQAAIVPEYDSRMVLDFVDTVPEDKEQRNKVAALAPHAPTIDEWREWMGLKPEGGELGKGRIVQMNSYVTTDPLDNEKRPQPPAKEAGPAGAGKKPDAGVAAKT